MCGRGGGVPRSGGSPPAAGPTPADGPVLPLGSWTHLVGTFDGSTVRLYVNGALFSSAPASGPLRGGAGQGVIGRLGQGVFPSQGTLDEVAVFPSALSAGRLRGHYQASSAASVRVSASASAAGTLRATATATGAEADPDPSSNSLSFTSTVSAPRADLVLSGSVSPEPANIGDPLTYQLGLQNKGPAPASAVSLTLQLPPEISATSASTSQGSCTLSSAQLVSCALGPLEPGVPLRLLSDGPAGYWRLGEPAGATTAADASGNAITGSYQQGVSLGQTGAISGDSAAAFASGAALVQPNAAGPRHRAAVSVEAWVRPSAASQNGGGFRKTVGGAVNSQYMMLLEAGGGQVPGETNPRLPHPPHRPGLAPGQR